MSNHAVEDAFNTVKRLLGLSYLWTGSINGIQLQIWATWLFYAVLVDLGDSVADELSLPFDRISLEMIPMWSLLFSQCFKATEVDINRRRIYIREIIHINCSRRFANIPRSI